LRGFSLDRAFTAVTVLPTFVVMLCIFGIPLLFSLYLSFTGWALDQALMGGRFVGLANYEDLLNDPAFVGSLGITFGYTAATVAAQMVLGLAIALLLNIDLPYMRILRTALLVPMMITPIVGALCWKLLLEPSLGFFNYLAEDCMAGHACDGAAVGLGGQRLAEYALCCGATYRFRSETAMLA
jgi:multiple sugar transport system permease protein